MATFVLTAGRFRSLPSVVIAEGVLQQGHGIAAIYVVSPWRPKRLLRVLRQRGFHWLRERALPGWGTGTSTGYLGKLAENLGVTSSSLRRWSREHGIPLRVTGSLNDQNVVESLATGRQDAVIYSGGGILRGPFIQAAGRTLNAHAGPLPSIRGMNAAEWALLLGEPPEVTVHLIDRGIDTGRVLMRQRYDRTGLRSVTELRERAVATGVQAMLAVTEDGRWADTGKETSGVVSRQCFVMAPILRDLAELRLSR